MTKQDNSEKKVEEKKEKEEKLSPEEELKKELQKEYVNNIKKLEKLYVTRDELEKDFLEATVDVPIAFINGKVRFIKAHRMSHADFVEQLGILSKFTKLSNLDVENLTMDEVKEIEDIYMKLPEMCAKYCVDKSLDTDFWSRFTTIETQMKFITSLSAGTREATVSTEDLKSFR